MSILDRALRVGESKKFKIFERNVELINAFEPELELESDDELRERYEGLRERHLNGESLEDLLYESFALTREAGRRALGQRHFDVQLIGGMVLHDGSIAEMRTGEGKTLTATLPVVLNALASRDEDGHAGAGQGRPPRDGERLPGPPRRPVDEADLRPARRDRRHPPVGPERRRQERGVLARRRLRHQLGVRLRLPARQPRGRDASRRPSAATASASSTRSTTSSSTRRARR